MKYLRCSLSLLLACVLLLGHCSISSYAFDFIEDPREDPYVPIEDREDFYTWSLPLEEDCMYPKDPLDTSTFVFTPDDSSMLTNGSLYVLHYVYSETSPDTFGNVLSKGGQYTGNALNGVENFWKVVHGYREYYTVHADGQQIIEKGHSVKLDFDNFWNHAGWYQSNGSYKDCTNVDVSKFENVMLQVMNSAGDLKVVEGASIEFVPSTNRLSAYVEFEAPFDIYRMSVIFDVPLSAYGLASTPHDVNRDYGFYNATVNISVSEPSEYNGLLASIIDWLRSIKDGISGVASNIANLPSKIWLFISDGLKSLFIPSEDDIVALRYDWDLLLKDRFGAVYQAGTVITDFVGAFTDREASDSIHFPEVSVNLAGADFTFGGYDVQIVPRGFEWLFFSLKSLLDIVCTFAFVNALKKRFDNVIGGGSDDN